MADNDKSIEGDLADGIVMLEQILEVMPQDIDTLRALYGALLQCGQREKAYGYLCKLAKVVDSSHGVETIEFVIGELETFDDENPAEVAAQIARIRMLAADVINNASAAKSEETDTPEIKDADISEELALAWKLYEEDQLTQEEYSSVLHDLTETSSKEIDVPVSVLHVLNDRGFSQMNRIMNYLSTRSSIPCLSLLNFEINSDVSELLPIEIPAHEGALPFGFFGDDLLVAILNPFNNVLMEKVESASERRCHAYLVPPEEYDNALLKLRGFVAEAAA